MRIHSRFLLLALFATFALISTAGTLQAQTRRKLPAKASPEERGEAAAMLARFRQAAKDPDARAAVVQEAIQAGPAAVTQIMAAIQRELAPEVKRYSGKFYQRAVPAARGHLAATSLQEVKQLRDTVLGLKSSPDFSHETIVAKGDPAMKRLTEIFVINRREVLDQSKALHDDRQRLFVLGKLWEQCAVFLNNQQGAEGEKPADPPSFEKYLAGEEDLAAGLAGPMDPVTRATLAANTRLAAQLDPEEARAILALNLTRTLLGLPALAADVKLCAAARDHSQDMQKLKFFSHDSPVAGKKSPWDRAKNFGTTAGAENIAAGCHDGQAANQMWFHSPGHHTNMLGGHTRVGIGRSGAYFTEMFGK